MEVSVIVVTLNEEALLDDALATARGAAVHEVIVVDGKSTDRTREIAARRADRVIVTERGRANQMNVGAAAASGAVLLFLHADTRLPPGFDAAVCSALTDASVVGGRFDVCLTPSSPLIRLTGALMNLRSRLTKIATGDQAIFVRREIFVRMGGFPAIPLMEDIAFSRALKRWGRVACLRQKVLTSSRRWRQKGALRTILRMWTLRFLYLCGVSPERLRRAYGDTR